MRWRNASLMMIAVLMLGVLAGPASANKLDGKFGSGVPVKEVGLILDGRAKVGKNRTFCNNDGSSDVSGAGIGLPIVNGQKNAFWEITTPVTQLPSLATGTLKACGRLTKMFSAVGGGLGAACGSSKGWDGKGSVTAPGKKTIWLDKLGWKASVTTFVVTGQAVQADTADEAKAKKSGANDVVVAVIQTFGGAVPGCTSKVGSGNDPNKSGGAGSDTAFVINGAFAIANGAYPNPNGLPGTCKTGLANGCLYDPKKS